MSSEIQKIRAILQARFNPSQLEILDEGNLHAGHQGRSMGGGHFKITIVSKVFSGQNRLDQHRLVNDALKELFGREIHALALETSPPASNGSHRQGN